MNLTPTSEQTQLKDGVTRFVAERFPESTRRKRAMSFNGIDRGVWKEMADLGWIGAGLSEAEGGWGGSPIETMVILEQSGYGLAPQPTVDAAVHALRLVADMRPGGEEVAGIISGDKIYTVAIVDKVPTNLSPGPGGYELSGIKRFVPIGEAADAYLVVCQMDGEPALVKVNADASGIARTAYRTLGDGYAADIAFDRVKIASDGLLASGTVAQAALARAEQFAIAAACAEAVGIAQFLLDTTLDYVKTRRQFGQPIGTFQAVQHRLADMFVAVEEARSLSIMATVKLGSADSEADKVHAIAAAKAGVLSRTIHVAREAIQLHGGVGMTEDLPLGAGFRRIKAFGLAYGDEHVQLDRMAPGIKTGVYA